MPRHVGALPVTLLLAWTTLVAAGGPAAADTTGWSYIGTGMTASFQSITCPSTTKCIVVSPTGIIGTSDAGATWTTLLSSPPTPLYTTTCATTSYCWAAGDNQTSTAILATTNGGTTWTTQFSGPLGGTYDSVDGMACPSTSQCWAVGTGVTPGSYYKASILATANGGTTWARQYLGDSTYWEGVSCPSTSTCFVGGWGGVSRTTDGGSTWTDVDGGAFFDVWSISCPTTSSCWAQTLEGSIYMTSNGGSSWTHQTDTSSSFMRSITCPTTSVCFAVGSGGQVFATTNGGTTWIPQVSHTTSELMSVSCPTTLVCYAVGDNGTIIKTTNGGVGAGEDRPPDTPTLISPPSGSTQSAQFPPVFTINATDPDGTAYTGVVTVRNAANVVVASFMTAPAATGSNASGVPAQALPPGSYSWSAHAVDEAGVAGPEAGPSAFVVV